MNKKKEAKAEKQDGAIAAAVFSLIGIALACALQFTVIPTVKGWFTSSPKMETTSASSATETSPRAISPEVLPMTLNKDEFTYYHFPSREYKPLVKRFDDKTLICDVEGEIITWSPGQHQPFNGRTFESIGFKLSPKYPKSTGEVVVKRKKVNK